MYYKRGAPYFPWPPKAKRALGRDLWWCLSTWRLPYAAFRKGTGHERYPGLQSRVCPSLAGCAGLARSVWLCWAVPPWRGWQPQRRAWGFILFSAEGRLPQSALSLKYWCGLRLMGCSVLAQSALLLARTVV